jgi:alpha-tubulin suppressor-like RCC1 family protein
MGCQVYSRFMQMIRRTRAAVRKIVKMVVLGLCVGCMPAVLAGGAASARTSSGGTVEGWGHGKLSPVAVHLSGPVAEVGTSNSADYALLADGTLWAWGVGSRGELGDGSTMNSATPVRVKFPAGVKIASIPVNSMPWDTAFAIDTTGHVWGWGANRGGELCLGNKNSHTTPVKLPFSHVTAVAGADQHTSYDAGGTLYSCGGNKVGELGDGGTKSSQVPVRVHGLSGRSVTALVSGFNNIGALLSDGRYYDWGWNGGGQLGEGTVGGFSDVPVRVTLPAAVTQAVQGGNDPRDGHTLVKLSNGAVYAWGTNFAGQLGTGNRVPKPSPARIFPPAGVTYKTLAAGADSSYAVSATGHVYAWGGNYAGQLGDGSRAPSVKPVVVESHAISLISTTSSEVAVSVSK